MLVLSFTRMVPENLRYTKEHLWVRVEGESGTVGITFHAQKQLGDVVYVDLPKVGTILEQGRAMGSVESVKAVSEIFAPVSGEVVELNDSLVAAPENLNVDPYGTAWLVRIKMSTPADAAQLLSPADYQAFVGAESKD
jgi:glycine cleavage system H protein